MNNNFNSFYFLHTQKTGGRGYTYNILEPIKHILGENKIRWLNTIISDTSHTQWLNTIDDNTYVTCTFREPCQQLVSLFLHSHTIDSEGELTNKDLSNITKKDFLMWHDEETLALKNYQSKNIVFPTLSDKKYFFKKMQNNNILKEHVLAKIDKMSLFIKPEIITKNNQSIIQEKILTDLGITIQEIKNPKWQENRYKSTYSKIIYESLTNSEKEYIRSVSNIDTDIYETADLFWNINHLEVSHILNSKYM